MADILRAANIILGALAFFMLCLRTPQIVAKLASKRLWFSLAAFPIIVLFGTVWALNKGLTPTPALPMFTVAYLCLDAFLIRLPSQLRR